jgi:hypothetical protein
MSEKEIEIYRASRESQNKYTYFLLAAAGAAIALAVNQTHGARLAWSQAPLALGVLSWALSFLFGCRHVAYVNSTLYANFGLLKVESGQHPSVGIDPQRMAIAKEGIQQAIESNSKKANRFGHWQFRLLVTGAVFYIIWHVFEMYLRGISCHPM